MYYLVSIVLLACLVHDLPAQRVLISPEIDPLSELMVDTINSLNTTWKAKSNFNSVSMKYLKYLMGVHHTYGYVPPLAETRVRVAADLPDSFDSRTEWPNCSSIPIIHSQSACGSCWAFGAIEAMSDRICIASNQTLQVMLSVDDLLSCCGIMCGFGCNGGFPGMAWWYWVLRGIVTGDGLHESRGCRPNRMTPCEHHISGADCKLEKTPKCVKKCQLDYPKSYREDKYYGLKGYTIRGETKIQTEIMTYGPVEGALTVYSDFLSYGSGVYQRHSEEKIGSHAVRILGWGIEDGVDYWLVANSWGTHWGDKGYFKIKRGSNECGIENRINAGLPKL